MSSARAQRRPAGLVAGLVLALLLTAGAALGAAAVELLAGTYTFEASQAQGTPTASCPASLTFARVVTPGDGSAIAHTVASADARKGGAQCTGTATLATVRFSRVGSVPPGFKADDLLVGISGDGSWCDYTSQTLVGVVATVNETGKADINGAGGSVSVGDLVLVLAIQTRANGGNSLIGCVMKHSSTGGTDGAACFPGSGAVQLASGATVRMDALAVGDVVRVAADAVSPVIGWSHRTPAAVATYVRLVTASAAIDVTPGHYVYVDGRLVAAAAVAVGDRLEVVPRDGGAARLEAVTRVEARAAADGLYAPHTRSGDIVVGGVRASTYTTAVAPGLAHVLLAPVRVAFAVSGVDVLGGVLAGGASGGVPRLLQGLLPKGAAAY